MRDYAELIKQLRECGTRRDCLECPYDSDKSYCIEPRIIQAADAIEELQAKVRSVVHCKDCEWWTKQEASIQGRCARLAIYPTGEFYCASGSKREPPKGVE